MPVPGPDGSASDGTSEATDERREVLPFHQDPWHHKALTLFGVVAPFALTVWAITRLWGHGVAALDLGLLVGLWAITGMGISVGFHRMLTHRAFDAKPWVKGVWLAIGSMTMQGRAADWAATHVRHHAHADQEGDPHSPLEGFWHAHFGWLLRDRFVRTGPVYERIVEDPTVAFINRTFGVWALLGLAIPGLIGLAVRGTWQGGLEALLWGGVVRIFIGHHITWSVNSVSHMFGTRPYETTDQARNNAVVALLGFGEGWHNNHHAFPKAAFLGHRWWQFDPGKWAIKAMEKLGLAWDVWNPDEETLEQRRAKA